MSGVISVIDSSSLIDIKSLIPTDKRVSLYRALSAMAAEGRVVIPHQVIDEMKRGMRPKVRDEALTWLLSVESHVSMATDFECLRRVTAEVGDVIDHAKDTGEDDADPYVLACALAVKDRLREVRIVTEDRHDRVKLSLTTAAGILGITAVPLIGFIRAERIL